MKIIVRWVEELAMEIEVDSLDELQPGLPEHDLSLAETVDVRNWTWEFTEGPEKGVRTNLI